MEIVLATIRDVYLEMCGSGGTTEYTRERRVMAVMENYLDESDDMKVEIVALELFMDPEDSEVCAEICVLS